MRFVIVFLLSATTIHVASGLCNICSSINNLACVDRDKFQVCVDGLPVPPSVTCPHGMACTLGLKICSPEPATDPACTSCGKCDSTKSYACTGLNTFSLCLGSDSPIKSITYTCPGNLVCNVNAQKICIDHSVDGIGATCPLSGTPIIPPSTTVPTTSTVIDPLTSPNEFCSFKQSRGRHDILSDDSCTQYINCFESDNSWYGNVHDCPEPLYFNATTQLCGTCIPKRCRGYHVKLTQ